MNPDIEIFLQDAFKSMPPAMHGVGRVVVEPDYESAAALEQPQQLCAELAELISQQAADPATLNTHAGFVVSDLAAHPLLQKLIRQVTLHADAAEGPWVEVTPPGNWI